MNAEFQEGALTIALEGKIDSENAAQVEKEIQYKLDFLDDVDLVFDAKKLQYISSAGLRAFLKLKKKLNRPLRFINVSDDVYEIFSVTGFTEILDVQRSIRRISLKGCEKVSSALNGGIFELSEDEMVKVFARNIPLSAIQKERDYAQAALIAGVPTLIPYDVVNSELGYGIVYEKSGAVSLTQALKKSPELTEPLAKLFAGLLREMHTTEIPEGKLPDIKDRYREWIRELSDEKDQETKIFSSLIESIPNSNTYVHGNIDLNSVMLKDKELLLFDMSGSAHGNALFDLQSIFGSLVAIEKVSPGYCQKTFELSPNTCAAFWQIFFKHYMNEQQSEVESMNRLILKSFVLKEKVLNRVEQKNQLKKKA